MTDIKGQESFYKISADEVLKNIATARDRHREVRLKIANNLLERKALRAEESKAHSELMQSIGGDSAQQELAEVKKQREIDSLKREGPSTGKSRSDAWKAAIRNAALATLKAAGGELSNMDLASLIGQDPHGLSGLLSGMEEIEKTRMGRINNEVVGWKLKGTK